MSDRVGGGILGISESPAEIKGEIRSPGTRRQQLHAVLAIEGIDKDGDVEAATPSLKVWRRYHPVRRRHHPAPGRELCAVVGEDVIWRGRRRVPGVAVVLDDVFGEGCLCPAKGNEMGDNLLTAVAGHPASLSALPANTPPMRSTATMTPAAATPKRPRASSG